MIKLRGVKLQNYQSEPVLVNYGCVGSALGLGNA